MPATTGAAGTCGGENTPAPLQWQILFSVQLQPLPVEAAKMQASLLSTGQACSTACIQGTQTKAQHDHPRHCSRLVVYWHEGIIDNCTQRNHAFAKHCQ